MTFIFKETVWSRAPVPPLPVQLRLFGPCAFGNALLGARLGEMLSKGRCHRCAHASKAVARHPRLGDLRPASAGRQPVAFAGTGRVVHTAADRVPGDRPWQ